MALGDADITSGVFFNDFGETINFGIQNVKGNLDAPSKDALFDRLAVADQEYSLKVGAGAFNPSPVTQSTLTVVTGIYAGNYKVRAINPLDDGKIIEFLLRRL